MVKKLKKLIQDVEQIEYDKNAFEELDIALESLKEIVIKNHFLRSSKYLEEIEELFEMTDNLSVWKSKKDRLLQQDIQDRICDLAEIILIENKKIFIVHGRDFHMRESVCALLGRLKLDYVILDSEKNSGETIIEKFIRNAEECQYAIILLSADDLGRLDEEGAILRSRPRQNVVLELGYFLAQVGRENIAILHDIGKQIEKPSDFSGIVYAPFDQFGAWKSRLIKEMRSSGIFVDMELADRV